MFHSLSRLAVNNTIDRKKAFLALLLMLVIALTFWTQSRVPALDTKAQMGQRSSMSSIAFNAVIPVLPEQPFLERVTYSSINWAHTNWKGMTFGLLFAGAFLTFLRCFPTGVQSKNPMLNTLKGTLMGVPLGVCVNCTTPIAHGLYKAGSRLETVLATLMSSPTLNVIVLSMMFTLLPLHLAIIKLVCVLVFILIVMPFIVRFFGPKQQLDAEKAQALDDLENYSHKKTSGKEAVNGVCELPNISTNWWQAIKNLVRDYLANMFFIVKATLPLMLLAGVLGAFIVEAVPFGQLISIGTGVLSLAAIALMGAFLPVPIAFDVIIVVTLLASDFPVAVCMVLLFSLGIYSIYPALVIAHHISLRLSIALFVACVGMAVVSGVVAEHFEEKLNQENTAAVNAALDQLDSLGKTNSDAMGQASIGENENLIVAFKNCNLLSNEEQVQACILRSVSQVVPDQPSEQDCEQSFIKSPELISACKIGVRNSGGAGKSEDCFTIQTKVLRNTCFYALNSSKLDEGADKGVGDNYCQYILDPLLALDCQKSRQQAIRPLSPTLAGCYRMAGASQAQCQRIFFVQQADNPDNKKFCQKLAPQIIVKECLGYMASISAQKRIDLHDCENVGFQDVGTYCGIGAVMNKLAFQYNMRSELGRASGQLQPESSSIAGMNTPVSQIRKAPPFTWHKVDTSDSFTGDAVKVSYREDTTSIVAGDKESLSQFKKVPASAVGINHEVSYRLPDFFEPFRYGKGLASGDYNNDGWPDLAFASTEGVLLYQSLGQGQFSYQHLDLSSLESVNTFVVAFVDINNDGWLDLFFSTYAGPNYFLLNQSGEFNTNDPIIMKDENRVLTMATGFADKDRDGDLDFFLGNWSFGQEKHFNAVFSQNYWMTNQGAGFSSKKNSNNLGETLSVLLSDFNLDDYIDVIIANDYNAPDLFYLGNDQSGFDPIMGDQSIIPITPHTTMSYDSADFNNDLRLDLFSADMTFAPGYKDSYCTLLDTPKLKAHCEMLIKGWGAIHANNVDECLNFENASDRTDCLVAISIKLATRDDDAGMCERIPPAYKSHKEFCLRLAGTPYEEPVEDLRGHVPQKHDNKMLFATASGNFKDVSKSAGVSSSWWSWNSKAADLDNDEWQDLYIANGFGFGERDIRIHSNVFFHNQGDGTFKAEQDRFNLDDLLTTTSYTYVDMDNDGDLDIISMGVMSPPRIFVNNIESNNSISFQLRDMKANRFCINCKVIVSYGENGEKKQIRELKLSGGYMSFDDPVIHFGLGSFDSISNIEVIWSTGEKTEIKQNLAANRRYNIERIQ